MRLSSFLLSLCLHGGVLLLILYWPASPPIRPDAPPITISLVQGDAGGNLLPSPILGHMGEPQDGPLAPTPPAPMAEIAAPAREEIKTPAQLPDNAPEPPAPQKPEPVREPPAPSEPAPPKPQAQPAPEQPRAAEAKKPEPPKQEPKKPEPKKPEPKKTEAAKQAAPKSGNRKPETKKDPIAEALQAARKATSRSQSGDRGNAVEQALAQARKNAGGNRGGGGGEGAGPGGGGLGDVYIGQVMLAVRPNWGFASPGRNSLSCVIRVQVDMQGKVLDTSVSRSSGNRQFDASAVNAIVRTSQAGEFPAPPNPDYMFLDLVFTLDEMLGR